MTEFQIPVEHQHADKRASRYWPHFIVVIDELAALTATHAELDLIHSYIEYKVETVYTASYRPKVYANDGGPGDNGHNTVTLRKQDDGWNYWRATWEWSDLHEGRPLMDLLRMIEGFGADRLDDRFPTWLASRTQEAQA